MPDAFLAILIHTPLDVVWLPASPPSHAAGDSRGMTGSASSRPTPVIVHGGHERLRPVRLPPTGRSVDDAVGFVLFLVSWAVPVAVLVYVLRALNTIVLGIRSVNEAAQRSAAALERMEARGSGPA